MRNGEIKRTRLIDIAEAAGVSKITVSKVLNGCGGNNTRVSAKTAEKVKKIALSLNYSPNLAARQLSGNKSRLLGVHIDAKAPENTHDSLSIIERYASEKGYRCVVGYLHGETKRAHEYVSDFLGRNVEGVICLSHNYPDNGGELAKIFSVFQNRVFIEPPIDDDISTYVATDHRRGAFLLTHHLIELGHHRIALILPGIRYRQMLEREAGYKDALKSTKKRFDASLIWRSEASLEANETDMVDVLDFLLPASPDAVIAPGDGGAMWLIRILRSRGISVPEKISVTGFDLWNISQSFTPSITTVDLGHKKVALKAVSTLLDKIASQDVRTMEENIVIPPELVVAESCSHKN